MSILAKVVSILLTVACAVLAYLLVIWVLGMLGITIPENILRVIFVILVLAVIYSIVTGRFGTWWGPGA